MIKKVMLLGIATLLVGVIASVGLTPKANTPSTSTVEIHRNQPKRTNSWMSSLYSFPSANVFAFPGIYKLEKKGVVVSIPEVKAVERTVYGSGSSECTLVFGSDISKTEIVNYSDWSTLLKISLANGTEGFVRMTLGSPFLFMEQFEGVQLSCDAAAQTRYALQTFEPGKFRLTIFPIEPEFERTSLTNIPWDPIEFTAADRAVDKTTVNTTLRFVTENKKTTPIAIMPHHQTAIIEKPPFIGSYNSALGTLQLIIADSFTVTAPKPVLKNTFLEISNTTYREEIIEALEKDTEAILLEQEPPGVYFKGTYLGALSSAFQIAQLYKKDESKQLLLAKIEDILRRQLQELTYSDEKKMLIANNPEFGHENGNDHHFHWAYYIRAAAIVRREKPESANWLDKQILEMIHDIAETDRASKRHPYLRNFSPYESHSWADGQANFGDGNNQESTSEALNAWYALQQWAVVTGDTELEDLAYWLFSQELLGTKTYWFGNNNPFPAGYAHPMASLVWSGKRDFATWFSGEKMHIYGIQFLPITPASQYLSSFTNYDAVVNDIYRDGNPVSHEWGDLLLAYISYTDPEKAQNEINFLQSNRGGMKLRSILLQVIYQNLESK